MQTKKVIKNLKFWFVFKLAQILLDKNNNKILQQLGIKEILGKLWKTFFRELVEKSTQNSLVE